MPKTSTVWMILALVFLAAALFGGVYSAQLERALDSCQKQLHSECPPCPLCIAVPDYGPQVTFSCLRSDCNCVFEFIGKDGE